MTLNIYGGQWRSDGEEDGGQAGHLLQAPTKMFQKSDTNRRFLGLKNKLRGAKFHVRVATPLIGGRSLSMSVKRNF